jgi:hypothetical protein
MTILHDLYRRRRPRKKLKPRKRISHQELPVRKTTQQGQVDDPTLLHSMKVEE